MQDKPLPFSNRHHVWTQGLWRNTFVSNLLAAKQQVNEAPSCAGAAHRIDMYCVAGEPVECVVLLQVCQHHHRIHAAGKEHFGVAGPASANIPRTPPFEWMLASNKDILA